VIENRPGAGGTLGSALVARSDPEGGSAVHISAEKFRLAAGIEATRVPYRGGAEVITDILGGRAAGMKVLTDPAMQASLKKLGVEPMPDVGRGNGRFRQTRNSGHGGQQGGRHQAIAARVEAGTRCR
jgi:hypothetical protein